MILYGFLTACLSASNVWAENQKPLGGSLFREYVHTASIIIEGNCKDFAGLVLPSPYRGILWPLTEKFFTSSPSEWSEGVLDYFIVYRKKKNQVESGVISGNIWMPGMENEDTGVSFWYCVVAAVAWVWSMTWEIPHAVRWPKKKKKKKKNEKKNEYIVNPLLILRVLKHPFSCGERDQI